MRDHTRKMNKLAPKTKNLSDTVSLTPEDASHNKNHDHEQQQRMIDTRCLIQFHLEFLTNVLSFLAQTCDVTSEPLCIRSIGAPTTSSGTYTTTIIDNSLGIIIGCQLFLLVKSLCLFQISHVSCLSSWHRSNQYLTIIGLAN